MKEKFKIYYKGSEEEYSELWGDCIFVFDANVFLNLYRYSEETRNQLIDIMNQLKDRIWIPHQAALEYHSNRISVLLEQQDAFNNVQNKLQEVSNDFLKDLEKRLRDYNKQHPSINIKSIHERIKLAISEIIDDLKGKETKHPDFFKSDSILETLTEVFTNNVGNEYDQQKLDQIYQEGEKRYKDKYPPGYEDEADKKGKKKYYNNLVILDMYGDLIIWNQIIDKAIELNKAVIFITGDNKEDWWQKIRGRTIGPRVELLNEFQTKVNLQFHMYQPEKFIEYAQNYLNQQINTKAINEIIDLRNSDEEKMNLSDDDDLIEEFYEVSEPPEEILDEIKKMFNLNEIHKAPVKIPKKREVNYSIGEQVAHSKWGIGVIVNVLKWKGEQEIHVSFPAPFGVKRLLARYAPITKVET
ncbi:PIN-like domain-containing protein [Paenibacillus lentus]|uniref:PIN-like domain-containing protein n=1 Tax=Paenibacillus lentus TaxID=1338368 RepID=UPI0036660655